MFNQFARILVSLSYIVVCYCFADTPTGAIASAKFNLGHTDNLLKTQEQLKTRYSELAANVQLRGQWRVMSIETGLNLNKTQFSESEQDNTEEKQVYLGFNWQADVQHGFSANLGYSDSDEFRGEGISKNDPEVLSTPDHYTFSNHALSYRYNPASEKGMIVRSSIGATSKEYESSRKIALDNNLDIKVANLDLGYQWRDGRFFYFHLAQNKYEFIDAAVRNNTSKIYALGLNWQATAITGFDFKLGQEITTEAITSAEKESEYWSLTASWAPKTYSIFYLTSASQQSNSLYLDLALQLNREIKFSWQHTWANQMKTTLGYSRGNLKQLTNDQLEKNTQLNMALSYQVNRLLDIELDYGYEKNIDSLDRFDYRQNVYGLNLIVKLGS
ncbi:hypothetical protein [Catenovulum maritimum]|uniref:Uncharacterized protein n=1 Tax=Catenovulum maritimum TaxID=1513271 RepID=A0A0J8JLZ0_9ALTE|nr:hypothetical protein [Catenovulum maritimum]KMT65581.1 hypothetical protein XM47_07725 [Catenovulum maritimum]